MAASPSGGQLQSRPGGVDPVIRGNCRLVGYTTGMTDKPIEQEGVPYEEQVEDADVVERIDQDPELVPNAPNRDPWAEPGGKDAQDDSSSQPRSRSSADDPSSAQTADGGWSSSSR